MGIFNFASDASSGLSAKFQAIGEARGREELREIQLESAQIGLKKA